MKKTYDSMIIAPIIILAMLVEVSAIFILAGRIGHELGPEAYGDFSVAVVLFTFFGQLLTIGLDSIFVKYVPPLFKQGEFSRAKFYTSAIIRIVSTILGVWVIISIIINIVAHRLIHNTFLASYIHPSIFFLGYAVVWAIYNLGIKMLRGLNYKFVNIIMLPASTVIALALIFMVKELTLSDAIMVVAFSVGIVAVIALIVVFYSFKRFSLERYEFPKGVVSEALHYIIQQIVGFPATGVLLIIVEAARNVSESDVGVVAAIFLVPRLLLIIPLLIRSIFAYKISLIQKSVKAEIKQLLVRIRVVAILVIVTIMVAIYLFTPEIVGIFGTRFGSVLVLMPYGIAAATPGVIIAGEIIFINYSNYNNNYSYILLAKAIFTVLAGISAIYMWGFMGAIAILVVEEIIFAIAIYAYSKYILHRYY